MSEESGEIRVLAFLREDIFLPGVISVGQEKKQRHTELIASNNIGWRSVRPFYSPEGRVGEKKILQKKLEKIVELVGGGSVINGAYPV